MTTKSSSRQTQTTNITENTFTSADYSSGDGLRLNMLGAEVGGNVNVNTSDYGAIAAAMGLGESALSLGRGVVQDSLDYSRDVLESGLGAIALQNADHMANLRGAQQHSSDQIQRALAHAAESDRSETAEAFNQLAQRVLFALAAVAAVWLIWGRK